MRREGRGQGVVHSDGGKGGPHKCERTELPPVHSSTREGRLMYLGFSGFKSCPTVFPSSTGCSSRQPFFSKWQQPATTSQQPWCAETLATDEQISLQTTTTILVTLNWSNNIYKQGRHQFDLHGHAGKMKKINKIIKKCTLILEESKQSLGGKFYLSIISAPPFFL